MQEKISNVVIKTEPIAEVNKDNENVDCNIRFSQRVNLICVKEEIDTNTIEAEELIIKEEQEDSLIDSML